MKSSVQRNVWFGFLSLVLPLVSTIIVTPFVVGGLGAAEYGLYALALGFISYSFNFGFGRAVAKYVSEYLATGETERIGEILSATIFLSLLVGLTGVMILVLATRVFVIDVLLIENALQNKAMVAFYLAATTIVLLMLQQVFSAVLQAAGRYDWFSHLTTFFSTLLSVGNLILVWRGGDAVALLWWNLILTITGAAVFAIVARRSLPEIPLGFGFSRKSFWQVTSFNLGIIGYQIAGNILLLFERSWITRRLGTESLTFYVLPMSIAILIVLLLSSVSLVLMPLASEVAGRQETARLLSIYQRATKYISFIVVFICVSLCVGGEKFLNLWLGAEFAERSSLILIFHVLTWGMMSFGIVTWHINEGIGLPGRNAWMGFLWLVIGGGLMIALTPQFGLAGVAAGRSAGVLLTYPFFILIVEKLTFGKVLWKFWSVNLAAFLLAGTAAGFAEHFLLTKLPLGWLSLTAAVAASGLIYLGILLLLRFFTSEELDWLKQFAARAAVLN